MKTLLSKKQKKINVSILNILLFHQLKLICLIVENIQINYF